MNEQEKKLKAQLATYLGFKPTAPVSKEQSKVEEAAENALHSWQWIVAQNGVIPNILDKDK